MLVEAFITQPAVEALDEPVLLLARCNAVPQQGLLFLPGQDHVRGHPGAVVADDHQRRTTMVVDPDGLPAEPFA